MSRMPAPVRKKRTKQKSANHKAGYTALAVGGVLLVPIVVGSYFGMSKMTTKSYDSTSTASVATPGADEVPAPPALDAPEPEPENDIEEEPPTEEVSSEPVEPDYGVLADTVTYVPIPEEGVKAIYMSQCVSGTPNFRNDLVRLVEETELNAIIIDVKDYSGGLGYIPIHPTLKSFESDQCGARDLKGFLALLHSKGIYTIARITVFQDPLYTKTYPGVAVKKASNKEVLWEDHKGLNFIDVSAKQYWEHLIILSREVHALGFDELNYDYIRFPSDGPMNDIYFPHSLDTPRAEAVEKFWKYLHREMKDESKYPPGVSPPILSADLFGMTATNIDDLSIGQVLERAMPYFDYIAPMVYPSHYPNGWNGFDNPNNHAYDIIKISMTRAGDRAEAKRSPAPTLDSEKIYETRTIEIASTTASTTETRTEEVFTGYYTKKKYPRTMMRPWLQDFDYGGNYDVAEVRAQIQATYDSGLKGWMLWAPSNRYTRGALKDAKQELTVEDLSGDLEIEIE